MSLQINVSENRTDEFTITPIGSVVKPFSLDELNARIKAVLRRGTPEEAKEEINIGNILTIDPQRYLVMVKGRRIELTSTEFRILELLALRKGHVFRRQTILDSL